MADDFDRLLGVLDGALIGAFGAAATITPRAGGQYTERAADPDRLPAALKGIFSAGAADTPIAEMRRGQNFSGRTSVVSERPEFWVPAAGLAALGWRPLRADLIEIPGRGRFAIAHVQPSDCGGLNLILTAEDEAP